jgi:DNA-binding response OmpR family regulator/predicted negative regulator of RcsB-dependent stress response
LADLAHQLQIQPRFGARSRALVVDGHATARTMLASQLRALGVGQVLQCATAHDARQHMANLGVDVMLVEYLLDNDIQGQTLIDELRRDSLLSLRTVVVMLSTQASYQVVAQVAESALDGFIIKPYTPGKLEDRLIAAFQRKDALREVYDAIENDDHAQALSLCEKRYQQRGPYWTHAARLGAELALRLEQLPLASAMYAAVLADKAVPWAKLGLARVLQADGHADAAVSTIRNLLADEPKYADAYDVMGRIHAEQGDMAGAIAAYKQAVEITPFSVARAQKYGILAWYAAEPEVALAALEHAASIGGDSPQFDHQTLLLLAMARFQSGDADGLRQCDKQLASVLSRQSRGAAAGQAPDGQLDRLRRLGQMTQALVAVQAHDRHGLQACMAPVADGLMAPGFDVEAATNLLSLIATSAAAGLAPQQADHWTRSAGLRFCVSKQVTEMLAKACDPAPSLGLLVRAAHAEINEISRNALSEGLAGRHQRAVEELLKAVERTRNAKLLELAQAALERHRANIAEAEALAERCGLLQRLCSTVGRSHLLAHDTGRAPGALDLPPRGRPGRRGAAAPA